MSENETFVTADKMLAAMDFASELQKAGQRHEDELKAVLRRMIKLIDALESLEERCSELVAAGHEVVPVDSARILLKMVSRDLGELEVAPMNAPGQSLDLALHEVDAVEVDSTVEEDTVLRETRKGYLWKGELLRAAKVVVSKSAD